jgi:hypothetical protein
LARAPALHPFPVLAPPLSAATQVGNSRLKGFLDLVAICHSFYIFFSFIQYIKEHGRIPSHNI